MLVRNRLLLWLMHCKVCECDESKSEGCLVSAIDCANDSSSRQPLITPLTDSGAAKGGGESFPRRLVHKASPSSPKCVTGTR